MPKCVRAQDDHGVVHWGLYITPTQCSTTCDPLAFMPVSFVEAGPVTCLICMENPLDPIE